MSAPNWTLHTFRLSKLKDYHKNPRKLTKEQFAQLDKSLKKFGLIDKPICTMDGLIIGGHQRKKVLQAQGVQEVECYVPDRDLTEKEIEELCLRLNKNVGEWDYDLLADTFEVEDLIEWGFSEKDLLGSEEKPDAEIKNAGDEEEKVTCPSCGHCFTNGS